MKGHTLRSHSQGVVELPGTRLTGSKSMYHKAALLCSDLICGLNVTCLL